MSQPGMFAGRVVRWREVCEEHVEIRLSIAAFLNAQPGQFVQVLCRAGSSSQDATHGRTSARDDANTGLAPLLRRPLSLGGLRQTPDGCEVDLLFRVVGPGTTWLASRRPGDAADIMGPFGRGFSSPPPASRVVLVAGGIGWPPIRWFGETLKAAGVRCACVCGARNRAFLPVTLDGEPSADGRPGLSVRELALHDIAAVVTTDDGSCGMRGTVTDGMRALLDGVEGRENVRVFACGPYAMLRAVARLCAERELACEVAMEQMMACGMGTCQSCVVPVRDANSEEGWRYRLCCSDGPVFDAASVIWEQPVR